MKWHRRAAEQGLAEAQLALALKYYQGKGVAKDLSAAHAWASSAVAQGNEEARLLQDVLEELTSRDEPPSAR